MKKKVAIIQSNYIPWKGYFHIIQSVDDFVLLDDVQYTRRDWRNRNLIKTKSGLKWLTIPVEVKGNYHAKINEVCSVGSAWRLQHWNYIREAYQHSRYYQTLSPDFKELYLGSEEINLSKINLSFIKLINLLLNINTPLHWSMDFGEPSEKTERLVHICQCLNATAYLSGSAAKEYLNVDLFLDKGIEVLWADYSGFKEYSQLHPPFEHGVSVIDLLFNEGPNALTYLKDKLWM